mmetsp:Transcript_32161/g.72236  ORF Transcript_32161/g.72236 Transcript_32161/m.72236 type:complete len:209 (-) Transcript_32161:1753-2379(-)
MLVLLAHPLRPRKPSLCLLYLHLERGYLLRQSRSLLEGRLSSSKHEPVHVSCGDPIFMAPEGKRLVHVLCHGSHVESRLSLIAPGEDRHALHQRPKHAIRADLRSVPFGVHVRQCRPAAALGEQLGPHLPSRGANVTDHAEPSSRTGQEGVWLDLRRRSAEMVQEDKRAGGVGKRRKVVVGEAPEHCRVPDRDPEALGMDMVLPCVGD